MFAVARAAFRSSRNGPYAVRVFLSPVGLLSD